MRFRTQLLAGLAFLALPALAFATTDTTTQPAPNPDSQMGIIILGKTPEHPSEGSFQLDASAPSITDQRVPTTLRLLKPEKAGYLGIAVVPAGRPLESQLKLPRNTGLLVNYVDPNGPASSAGIVENDVLTKFDDQLLIDYHQLAVLVRNQKLGDAVKLTVIHEGQPQVITVKLNEKEAYPLDDDQMGGAMDGPAQFPMVLPNALKIYKFPDAPAIDFLPGADQSDMTVTRNGQSADLHTGVEGITVTVTENGKVVSESKAGSLEDLQKNNPTAYKVFEEFFGGQAKDNPHPEQK